MTVEEPDARVVGLEAKNEVAGWAEDDGIATHGNCGVRCFGCVAGVKCAGIFVGALDYLEVVAMEMERVFTAI